MRNHALKILMMLALAAPTAACATKKAQNASTATTSSNETAQSEEAPRSSARPRRQIFGKSKGGREQPGIGVNAYLWRATLDTLGFMPVLSADPFGGTYITDWHASAQNPAERFKIQVFILDTRLRADGIAVRVFRQTGGNGVWSDANVDPDTPLQIENAILTRARQLRIATLESTK